MIKKAGWRLFIWIVKPQEIREIKQVEMDLVKIIIRDSNGYIFYTDLYDPKFISNTTWIQLPGANWASITTNNGLLCATTTTGKIYINSKTKFKDIWEAL